MECSLCKCCVCACVCACVCLCLCLCVCVCVCVCGRIHAKTQVTTKPSCGQQLPSQQFSYICARIVTSKARIAVVLYICPHGYYYMCPHRDSCACVLLPVSSCPIATYIYEQVCSSYEVVYRSRYEDTYVARRTQQQLRGHSCCMSSYLLLCIQL